MAIFSTFFLGNIVQENVFYHILERKNAFLGYKSKKLKGWKNWHFSKGVNSLIWSINGHFSISFFRAMYTRKVCFTIFYNEKKPFLAITTRISKSWKIDIFQKGLTHGFGPKMTIFPSFFLCNIGQESVFYHILERKNAFFGYNNRKFK